MRLAGFLSYREPQELTFESARLWLLTGSNGSGKSALFDAITWALFHYHRGGSQNSGELIHKQCDRCDIQFDFLVGNDCFRIDRILKKTKSGVSGSFVIRKQHDGGWIDVPDTHRKLEFDAWIREHIGLDYDAFTTSTLLRQGHAEKLLDATPKGRAEILASVARLGTFADLYERANQERLKCKAIADALVAQCGSIASASADEVATSRQLLAEAEAEVVAAWRQVHSCEELLDRVKHAQYLKLQCDEAVAKVAQAESLIVATATIESAFRRLTELGAILPAAETIVVTRGRQDESKRRTERFLKQQSAVRQQKEKCEHSLAAAKSRRSELKAVLAGDEEQLSTVSQRLRTLASLLQTVKLLEEQEAECERLEKELESLPAALPARLADASNEVNRLLKLGQELPLMRRLLQTQSDHDAVTSRLQDAIAECGRIRRDGETERAAFDLIRQSLVEADAELQQADAERAGAELQKRLAETAWESITSLSGLPMCHFCGQPMTVSHLKEEQSRREARRQTARESLAGWDKRVGEMKARVQKLRNDEQSSNARLAQLRQDYRDQTGLQAAASRDLDQSERAILELQAALSPSAIAVTTESLSELEIQFATLDDEKRRWLILQELNATNDSLQQQLLKSRMIQNRLRNQLPEGNPAAFREEYVSKNAEEASIAQAVKAGRKAIDETEREIDQLGRQAHEALTEFTELTGHLRTEESTRAQCGEMISRALSKLSAEWRTRLEGAGLADYTTWKDEHDSLTAKRVAVSYRLLEAARGHIEELRNEAARLDAEWRTAEAATPEAAMARLSAARTELQIKEAAVAIAREGCRRLEEAEEQNRQLSEQVRESQRHLVRLKRTCDLLGRDGIPRILVREAERAIVEQANAVLRRLTDEKLTLQLADEGGSEKALELQAVCPAISPVPINVAFLSGSQRFRIAVALAIGVGEFASNRCPPCLMIDEGFGSLDIKGRTAMIREFHSLERLLARVLVVSHDDEFAAGFENAYRFELVDGATRIVRK